ncbi:MAG TPA: DMT family transporter, partial [Thermodesulfobacteriota bacterium]|nr:DMT family transporter [Thermodesulfobacteriota bacterium]
MPKLQTLTESYPNILSYLALFVGLFGLGISAILVKWANAPGVISAFYRVAIATAIMTIPFGVQIKRSGSLKRNHILWAVLAGVFFACDLGTWHPAALMTSAANAALFGNLSAVWVGLAALILFKEKLRGKFWIGLLGALIGATMIIGEDFYTHITLGMGSVLATIASFFYAGFLIATQRAREGLSSLTSWWISAV